MKRAVKVVSAACALAALLGVGFVALHWAPDRSVAELKERWAPPPSVFVNVSGMSVHLRDEGPRDDPSPIVLLHGTASSLHTWEGWARALRGRRRVIRFDLPGFGLTGPAPDGDYSIERYVRFVAAVLEALGVRRCVLGGNSLGGRIAWESALALPGVVQALLLVDAGGYPLHARSVPIGLRMAQIPLLNRLMELTLPRGMVEASVRSVYGDPRKVTPDLVDRYFDLTLRAGNRRALAARFRQSGGGSDPIRLREIKVPALILWGAEDRLLPPGDAERFHGDIAGSRLVLLSGLGHVPQEEDPVRSLAPVEEFLATLPH